MWTYVKLVTVKHISSNIYEVLLDAYVYMCVNMYLIIKQQQQQLDETSICQSSIYDQVPVECK